MINKKIEDVKIKLDEEKKIIDYQKASITYSAFWDKYKKISQSINDSCISFLSLNKFEIIDIEKKDEVEKLLKKVLLEMGKIEIENPQEMNNIIFNIQNDAAKIKNILSQEWGRYVTENLKGYINMINVLRKVFDIGELKIVQSYLELRKKDFPINEKTIEDFKGMQESFDGEIDKYKMNQNIKDFLIKIGRNEATLTDLDDEILNWFNKMDINNHIKLRLE